jgi:oxygen-independent coproporphyrinogen III oxidase
MTLPQGSKSNQGHPDTGGRRPHSNAHPQDIQTLALTNPTPVDALYLHIPFCFHKCHYCDFYSIVDDRKQGEFGQALGREISHKAGQFKLKPRTVFIGGGTPTYLAAEHWKPILKSLSYHGVMENVAEFTVEANPETVTRDIAQMLADAGVNRMSLGAQSFEPELLKALERWHDPASIPRAMDLLRNAGITNLNLDLIFAIPGQTVKQLESDLNRALALGVEHLSVYGLTYEPNTVLTKKLELGRVKPADEDVEKEMYGVVLDVLAGAGFRHYEVSNFARLREGVDRRCAHNLAYWNNLNWLGLGPGAGSHHEGWLWKNLPHLHKYIESPEAPPMSEFESFDPDRRVAEKLMLGLRLIDGLPEGVFDALVGSNEQRRGRAEYLLQVGMLQRVNGYVKLTRAGLFVADTVIGELM